MIQTSWGYTLLDAATMPSILTVEEFNSMTANKYALDSRVQSTINSVTAAVRNYCGWHIAGSQRCEIVLNAQNLHITKNYNDTIIQLPYRFISSVESVIFNAERVNDAWVGDDDYEFSYNYRGAITVYDSCIDSRKSTIVIVATVGLAFTDDIKSIIANKVSHVLSGTYGVQSETAGGLSISYSSSFVNGAKASAFMTDDKEILNAYKVVELL